MMRADPDWVISAARGWLGTPYHNQATMKHVGCDCLGLLRGVWREIIGAEPAEIPRYSRDWGERGDVEVIAVEAAEWMLPISLGEIGAGSVILFRMREGAIAKHCGIMTGPRSFIHSYERTGVIEQKLTEPWRRRIAFAFEYPAPNAEA